MILTRAAYTRACFPSLLFSCHILLSIGMKGGMPGLGNLVLVMVLEATTACICDVDVYRIEYVN